MYPSIEMGKILPNQHTQIWMSDRQCIRKKIICYMKDFAVNVIKVQNIFLGS